MGAAPSTPSKTMSNNSETKTFTAYHGTSWKAAQNIALHGFQESADGQLGRGVYVAKKDKATRFAENTARHGGDDGVLIKCEVTVDNPKFLRGGGCKTSDHAGHDAVRTNNTASSHNPEWAIRGAKKVKPVEMTRIKTSSSKRWRKCAGCSYQANDNPAYHNVKPAIDHAYCCTGCRLGVGHGGWCQHKCA